jgi:TPP-dependent indolepyruvate ferredoxin oxidoreductase alpha subunit
MHMIPVLEPSTPAEACAMTRFAFTLSEESRLPVILRITPRVAHVRGVIETGEIQLSRPRIEALRHIFGLTDAEVGELVASPPSPRETA